MVKPLGGGDDDIVGSGRLHPADRPLRVAEFDAVFARGLHGFHRAAPGLLRLILDGEVEEDLTDLIARETECCSFFTFTTRRADDRLIVDVEVPPDQEPVLDALALAYRSYGCPSHGVVATCRSGSRRSPNWRSLPRRPT